MESAEIKRRFLDYFATRGHHVVPSAPLPSEDPQLLFVVAGMVPFLPYFLGQQSPPWPRATSVQKCVRTLDIEEVGKTTRHGTFFQMDGNFSFGDYFKEGAISYAWELVTGSQDDGFLGFDPDKIWVTVLHSDDEAARIWRDVVGLPEERIQRRGLLDNYWHMGVPGPGGPCSEIYVDRGPAYGPDGGPIVDEDRFLEIWNLVFMQEGLSEVRRKDDFDVIGPLPKQNIDTGLGQERVAYLLQGVDNLYEIDEVRPVLDRAAELAGVRYGADHDTDVRLRVVADHVRSALMIVGDGVTPANEGRGYVLRRLVRRAVRSMRLLGVDEPMIIEPLTIAKDQMARSYPDLDEHFGRIRDVIVGEEAAFRRTLAAGTTILDVAVRETKDQGGTTLSAERAFALHDTYGFPIDLTLEMAGEQGLEVDHEGFKALMAEQRDRAKADSRAKKSGHGDLAAYRAILDEGGPTPFTGHSELARDTVVRGLVLDGAVVDTAEAGAEIDLVLDATPFYAESGGQVADHGVLSADGVQLEVLDVQRPVRGLIAHRVRVLDGAIRTGAAVRAEVDRAWRVPACQAHSATHIVHAALRQVLGPTALQSGSYNRPGYLRLDFAWGSALSEQQRADVEEVANQALRDDLTVRAQIMPLPAAKELGALALFGETYGEDVRVVEIGGPWSRELCGGTHVAHSSQVGAITLTGESSVGSGMRRVEATVGLSALETLQAERSRVAELTELLKVRPEGLRDRVEQLVLRLRAAERELQELRAGMLGNVAADLAGAAADVYGVAYVGHRAADETSADDLRGLVIDVRDRLGADRPAVVVAIAVTGGRPAVAATVNTAGNGWGLKAGELVKVAATTLGGGGGGRDDIAQGGGKDPARVDDALAAVRDAVGQRVTGGS